MIKPVITYALHCDNCNENFIFDEIFTSLSDEVSVKQVLGECDWYTDGDKHYCESCYSINDEDQLILDPKRWVKPHIKESNKILVIHDSDQVRNVITGTFDEILHKLIKSDYFEDISERLGSFPEGHAGHIITIITQELYHDGDSQVGYTIKKPFNPLDHDTES